MKIKKPNIAKLKSKGYTLIDMHVHTSQSHDCPVNLQSILKKAKKMNIGVAITDHDKIDSAISINNSGVLVIPGIEVTAKNDKHIIFYFYDKKELIKFYNNEIKNKFLSKTANELINVKDKYKCVAGIAHPTGHRMWQNFNINNYSKKSDFVEVLNGACSKRKAIKTYNWAIKHKKSITAGSDSHKLKELGKCLTCAKGNKIEDILNQIKNRKTSVTGLPLSLKEKLKKLPQDTKGLVLWILAKIYLYSGVKYLFKKKFKK